MSYDVSFSVDGKEWEPEPGTIYRRENGGIVSSHPEELSRNYTSNVSPMWAKALGGQSLGDLLDPEPVAETLIEPLTRAIHEMMEAPEVFRAMNPPNGWGDYEGALAYLVWIRDTARRYPKAIVSVWR